MISGTVAIVGRPNVGKSTLFNRLTRSRQALVDNRPGVTRDRIYGTLWFEEHDREGCLLVDTGGFETKGVYYQPFKENLVWQQTELAISEASIVILLLDGKTGLHPHDADLTRYLMRKGKRVLFVVNKIDFIEKEPFSGEFYQLGIDELFTVSASHGRGVEALVEKVQSVLKSMSEQSGQRSPNEGTRIAIIGRPNAGKSSLLNRLVGEERSLVSEIAGTTRDTVNTQLSYNHKPYVIVDTAGIRRRTRITDKLESLCVMMSFQAIENADVVLLVIDARENLADQDSRLADLVTSQHKPMAIVVNKWDLIEDKSANSARDYEAEIRYRLPLLTHVPIIFISCTENQRVHRIMALVEELSTAVGQRKETRKINEALREMVFEHTPALVKKYNKRPKFYYATQVAINPPTIVVFCNVAGEIQESYRRYMANRFRDLLGYGPTPLRLVFRSKEEVRARHEEGGVVPGVRAVAGGRRDLASPQGRELPEDALASAAEMAVWDKEVDSEEFAFEVDHD